MLLHLSLCTNAPSWEMCACARQTCFKGGDADWRALACVQVIADYLGWLRTYSKDVLADELGAAAAQPDTIQWYVDQVANRQRMFGMRPAYMSVKQTAFAWTSMSMDTVQILTALPTRCCGARVRYTHMPSHAKSFMQSTRSPSPILVPPLATW